MSSPTPSYLSSKRIVIVPTPTSFSDPDDFHAWVARHGKASPIGQSQARIAPIQKVGAKLLKSLSLPRIGGILAATDDIGIVVEFNGKNVKRRIFAESLPKGRLVALEIEFIRTAA